MIGLLDDIDTVVGSTYQHVGDAILLFGDPELSLDGSEYLVMQYDTPGQDAPDIDLRHEKNLQELLVALASKKLLHSAHDISDGGLLVALAEKAIMNTDKPLGFDIDIENAAIHPFHIQQQLFSEAQGRVLVSIAPESAKEVIEEAVLFNVPVRVIGKVTEKKCGNSHQRTNRALLYKRRTCRGVFQCARTGAASRRTVNPTPSSRDAATTGLPVLRQ